MKRVLLFQLSNSSLLRDENRDRLELITNTRGINFEQYVKDNQEEAHKTTDTLNNNNNIINNNNVISSNKEFEHRCNSCHIVFTDKELRNQHYRSPLHRYNLKLKLVNLPSVGEAEYDRLVKENKEARSNDSDDSDSDDDSSDEDEEDMVLSNIKKQTISGDDDEEKTPNDISPEQQLQNELNADPKLKIISRELKLSINLWKCIFGTPSFFKTLNSTNASHLTLEFAKLCHNRTPITFAVLLCSGGRFAGALYKAPELTKAFEHKTFHRYTTRKKQGGSQMSKDQQGGNKHSAGAAMRRYNEKRIREDVIEVMEGWRTHLAQCTYVFVFAPKGNTRDIIFYPNSPITIEDPRVRNVPFPIIRPTYAETQRVSNWLFTADIELLDENLDIPQQFQKVEDKPMPSQQQQPDKKQTEAPISKPKEITPSKYETDVLFKAIDAKRLDLVKKLLEEDDDYELPIPNENDSIITPLYKAVLNKDLPMIEYLITALPSDMDVKIPSWYWRTALHRAVFDGDEKIIKMLLEKGANPTVLGGVEDKESLYDVTSSKHTRQLLREWAGDHLEQWDWKSARIDPLTKSMAQDKEQKKKDKKKQQKAKKAQDKVLKEQEEKEAAIKQQSRLEKLEQIKLVDNVKQEKQNKESMLTERERRALAAEQRLSGQSKQCNYCSKPIPGVPFERLTYSYCSTGCVVAHKKKLEII